MLAAGRRGVTLPRATIVNDASYRIRTTRKLAETYD